MLMSRRRAQITQLSMINARGLADNVGYSLNPQIETLRCLLVLCVSAVKMSDGLQFVAGRLALLQEFEGQEFNHDKLKFIGHFASI